MLDTVRSGREKDIHEWQQAIAEARYFIQKLCTPGGCVVDFFLGSGTTAVAAAELGRRFIGYEINAATIERAARRIAP
jgi:DNA modification methylase